MGGHGCREYFEDVNNTRVKFEQTLWGHIRNFFQLAKERCLLQISINPGIILILVTHDKRDVAFVVDMASKWPSLGLILALHRYHFQQSPTDISVYGNVQSPNTGPCLEVRQCASSLSLSVERTLMNSITLLHYLYKAWAQDGKKQRLTKSVEPVPYAPGSNCVSLNHIVLRSRSTLLFVPIF